jgi:signal transduction histidine kinase
MPGGSERWFQTTRRPVVVDGIPVAVMGVSVDITDRKEAEDQLLVYHEELRSLASEIANIEDKERRRIAGELHDRIGQNLAVAKLKLEILTSNFSSSDYGKDHEEVLQLIDQTLNDTYSLTFEISPPMLYELGLSPALEWLGEQFQKQHNIEFVFEDDEKPMPINDDLLGPIYRAVRELLINVAKHARAKKVKVVISNTGNNIKLTVIDDGIGFNPDTNIKADGHGGFGLFSIKERLNHLGGKLVIKSKPEKGSEFTLVVPIRDINENKPEKINEY